MTGQTVSAESNFSLRPPAQGSGTPNERPPCCLRFKELSAVALGFGVPRLARFGKRISPRRFGERVLHQESDPSFDLERFPLRPLTMVVRTGAKSCERRLESSCSPSASYYVLDIAPAFVFPGGLFSYEFPGLPGRAPYRICGGDGCTRNFGCGRYENLSGAISWLTFFAGGAADVRRCRSDWRRELAEPTICSQRNPTGRHQPRDGSSGRNAAANQAEQDHAALKAMRAGIIDVELEQ
jgi:hypothetical protein